MKNKKEQMRLLLPCYYSFFANGAMVLLVGAILPYLMEEAQISYSAAGSALSFFAFGNLVASFLNPFLVRWLGRKITIIITSIWIPICFFTLVFVPPLVVIYMMLFMCGVARGSCSIFLNGVVNDNSEGNPAALSFLHMVFAIGAFIAPFLMTIYLTWGWGWRSIVYTIIGLTTLSTICYGSLRLGSDKAVSRQEQNAKEYQFLKVPVFYILGMLMFFYLGLENCVNGWFITYFRNTGIMSDAYATNLVSLSWLMILLGRLMTGKLLSKIEQHTLILVYCIMTCACYFLLIVTRQLGLITIAIAGIGFFMAGIYPTAVSSCGTYIKGSTTGMSLLLAIAAIGGIITPKLVGMVADRFGMTTAILVLVVNMIGMVAMAVANINKRFRSTNQTAE